MTPPTWAHGDEALWHAYACAAMAGQTMNSAPRWADDMLKEHRRRWPAPVPPGESAAEQAALDAILRNPKPAPAWLREAVLGPRAESRQAAADDDPAVSVIDGLRDFIGDNTIADLVDALARATGAATTMTIVEHRRSVTLTAGARTVLRLVAVPAFNGRASGIAGWRVEPCR